MGDRNRRSSVLFWLMLLAAAMVIVYGLRVVGTARDCPKEADKTWKWTEARWDCSRHF